jgi:hypothetical protein
MSKNAARGEPVFTLPRRRRLKRGIVHDPACASIPRLSPETGIVVKRMIPFVLTDACVSCVSRGSIRFLRYRRSA